MTIEQLQEELDKLREDYSQLESNFDSMSEGYQESLLLYDRLEETCRELEETNRNRDIARLKAEESSRMKSEFIQQI
jgi:predicted nuclease with TOPRIM domain